MEKRIESRLAFKTNPGRWIPENQRWSLSMGRAIQTSFGRPLKGLDDMSNLLALGHTRAIDEITRGIPWSEPSYPQLALVAQPVFICTGAMRYAGDLLTPPREIRRNDPARYRNSKGRQRVHIMDAGHLSTGRETG